MDALGARVAGVARPGDGAVIRYRTDGTLIQAAEVTIGDRGATTVLVLAVRDPSTARGLHDWGALDGDGDGIPDATERALGLDPAVKDGDGPGGGWSDADGERVGYADDGERLLVAAVTHAGTPGALLGAGSYAFTAAGMPGGVPLTVSAAYAPVPVPAGLLPVVSTLGGVSVDGAPVQTGAGNTTPLFAGVRHVLAWERVTLGGRAGAGAGRYLVRVRRADGLELDPLGIDAFHLPLEAGAGCQAAGATRCEMSLPPLVPRGEDLALELVIDALDAADPTNRSRTAGFFFQVARDGDGDGVEDAADNCLGLANRDQRDTNGDGYGNLCDPDLNDDRSVNFADLALLKQRFFSADADADLTGDGSVNFADLALLKSRFFGAPGPSAVAP